jgi:hypothetical protein
VRLKPEHRASWLAQQLWGPPSNGDAYIDVGFFSPLVKRGARALGIAGSYDTARRGGSIDQIMDTAVAHAVDAAVQPLMGPPAKAAWVGITGTEPSITGLRDDRGHPMPQFIPAVEPQKPGAAGWAKTHVLAPLAGMNGFVQNIAAATGLTNGVVPHAGDPANHWLRMVVDLATPQLFSRPSDTLTQSEFLAKQRTSLEDRDRGILKSQIANALRDQDVNRARQLAQKGLQAGTLTAKDITESVKRARLPKDVAGFQSRSLEEQLEVMGNVTTDERLKFMPVLVRRLQRDFRNMPTADQLHVLEQLRNLHITPEDMRAHAQ